MPALRDDDPSKWNYDLHTEIKHKILRDYLGPWVTVLGSSQSSLAYVDGFAGRGTYNANEPGSPLIAINAALESMDARKHNVSELVCHLIEENPNNFATLEATLQEFEQTSDPRIKIKLYRARFSEVSDELLRTLRIRGQPAFVFVDPFGYDDPAMDVLGQFLQLPRVELFINLMFNFINFGISVQNAALAVVFDRLFGCTEWRALTSLKGARREDELVKLYRSQLKGRGAKMVTPFRMSDDDIDRTLYYLVHVTKHLNGATIMKSCMLSASSPGELGYGGRRANQMQALFNVGTLDLPDFLMKRFQGQTLTFNRVLEESIDEAGPCGEKEFRACLKEMRRKRAVTVQPVTSKSEIGLSKNDLITFVGPQR